jgi:ectoine hydroxylase-related dioxygenase (phytanoyl-CoA dioxygenase family)
MSSSTLTDAARHDRASQELRVQGYALLHGLVPDREVDALRDALDRLHRDEAHVPRQTSEPGTLRGYNLVRRSPRFREALQKSEVVALVDELLGSNCILHSFESRSALPGGGQQSLHRDMPFVENMALSINVVWMLDDFTEENGATRVVPGSFVRPSGPEVGRVYPDEVLATAPAGTLLLFNTLNWHGGGPNRTDRIRRAFHVHYCRSWIKPQRDHPRSMDAEALAGASPLLIRLLGYHSQMEYEPELNDHRRGIEPPPGSPEAE